MSIFLLTIGMILLITSISYRAMSRKCDPFLAGLLAVGTDFVFLIEAACYGHSFLSAFWALLLAYDWRSLASSLDEASDNDYGDDEVN